MSITKKIKICCEEAYVETIWCKQLLGGLIKELKKRRLLYEQSDQIEGDDYVVLLGMNREWVKKSVCKVFFCRAGSFGLSGHSKNFRRDQGSA